jgi:hypothetical protein
MPPEIDRHGTAARIRRLFPPMTVKDYICDRCQAKADKGMAAVAERLAKRRPSSSAKGFPTD